MKPFLQRWFRQRDHVEQKFPLRKKDCLCSYWLHQLFLWGIPRLQYLGSCVRVAFVLETPDLVPEEARGPKRQKAKRTSEAKAAFSVILDSWQGCCVSALLEHLVFGRSASSSTIPRGQTESDPCKAISGALPQHQTITELRSLTQGVQKAAPPKPLLATQLWDT